ncbi:Ku protein [Anaeromyxobacter sp. Red801]|uniref:non-homologous end joining protein Ku n=1 Tax=Anaeromyxobacter sp. Red801 TaxID=3411632 RepID=UPI003BA17C2F
MARAIWSGALTFGLVNIPVKLYTAVHQKEVRFHMLHDADGARIQLRRFCSSEEKEVPYEHIVKGYEVSPGRYVTVTREELEAFDPKATRTVEIHDFVELSEIDPAYFEASYYLVPDRSAAKAYRLLGDAMRKAGKVAIATAVLRTRESLCCVRPAAGGALALSTMNRADEIDSPASLELPEAGEPSSRELQMAEQLVASLSGPFEPERYPDLRRERVLELIERKAEGQTIEAPTAEPAGAEVVSLADALSASLAAARRRDGEHEAPARGERRHAAAAAARTAARPRAARASRKKRG